MLTELAVESARLTWPTARLADVREPQDVCNVPEEKLLPAPNHQLILNPSVLALVIAPVVSPPIVIVFFSHVFATEIEYDVDICLPEVGL